MINILKIGKAKAELIRAAEKVCDNCELCQANARKKGPSQSRMPEPADYEFNRTVGTDIIFIDERWDEKQGKKPPQEGRPLLNTVSWRAGLQVVARLDSRESTELRRVYRSSWKRHYGTPERLVCDEELGLTRGIFAQRCSAEGTEVDPGAAESSSHNAKTERAGQKWKRVFYKAKSQVKMESRDDLEELIEATTVAVNERGPFTRVFGRSIRLPEGTTDHEDVNLETISRYQAGDAALSRSIQYRMAARVHTSRST